MDIFWYNTSNHIPTNFQLPSDAPYECFQKLHVILVLQTNIWKITYLNCGERFEDIADHPSYVHILSSCKI